MSRYLKYTIYHAKNTNENKNNNNTNIYNNKNNIYTDKNNNNNNKNNIDYAKHESIFFPSDQDSLFWCYFIISKGDIEYDLLPNRNIVTTKQWKIQFISKIRENKPIVKMHKLDTLANIESNLANDPISTVQSIMTLFAIDHINIVLVQNKTYFEMIHNSDADIYIITEKPNKYVKKYGYEKATDQTLANIRNSLYKIHTIDKPIKSISSYTAPEILEIATKLGIPTLQPVSGKNKTKTDLYQSIIQYFSQ